MGAPFLKKSVGTFSHGRTKMMQGYRPSYRAKHCRPVKITKFGRMAPTVSNGVRGMGGHGTTRVCQRISKAIKMCNYYKTKGGVKLVHGGVMDHGRVHVPLLGINNKMPMEYNKKGKTSMTHYKRVARVFPGGKWSKGHVEDKHGRTKTLKFSTITRNGVEQRVPRVGLPFRQQAFYARRRSTRRGTSPPRRSWYKDPDGPNTQGPRLGEHGFL